MSNVINNVTRNYTVSQSSINPRLFKLEDEQSTTLHVVGGKEDASEICKMSKPFAVNFIKSHSTLNTAILSNDGKTQTWHKILTSERKNEAGKTYFRLQFDAFANAFNVDKTPLKISKEILASFAVIKFSEN